MLRASVSSLARGENKPLYRDFPGGPMVKTLCFQCKRFRKLRSCMPVCCCHKKTNTNKKKTQLYLPHKQNTASK